MSNHSEYPSIVEIKARAWHDGCSRDFIVKGQAAHVLAAFVRAKDKGVTALEISTGAYSFGTYVHDLRRDYGLSIEINREEYPGGLHGRYVLHTPVEILDGVFE